MSWVNSPASLLQAKAAEMMEQDHWRSKITQIRTDNPSINQAIERAEQDIPTPNSQLFDERDISPILWVL